MEGARDSRRLADRVEIIAAPIVRSLNLDLVGVECTGQGSKTLLRVFIDKPGGVTLADCEQVHISLGHALDVEDPVPHSYTLEVSSPGLDRPLRRRSDYQRAIGKLITVKLRQPLDGQWRLVGTLAEVVETGVTVTSGPAGRPVTVRLAWDVITEARLEVEF